MNTEDANLAAEEKRRIEQHEAVKRDIGGKVHADISRDANASPAGERAATDGMAAELKRKAVREVAETEDELERSRVVARTAQIVDYLFYLVYGIIAVEVLLGALGANQGAPFKRLMDSLSAPLLAPFQGLMPNPTLGRLEFRVTYVMALVVYMLLHMAVNGLLRLFVHHKARV